MEETQKVPQRTDPSPSSDRQAIDVTCTKKEQQNHSLQIAFKLHCSETNFKVC